MLENIHSSCDSSFIEPKIQPNLGAWDQFYSGFTPKQRDQFHARVLSHFSRLIRGHLQKMRESAKKLKQSQN